MSSMSSWSPSNRFCVNHTVRSHRSSVIGQAGNAGRLHVRGVVPWTYLSCLFGQCTQQRRHLVQRSIARRTGIPSARSMVMNSVHDLPPNASGS